MPMPFAQVAAIRQESAGTEVPPTAAAPAAPAAAQSCPPRVWRR
ncbi:DUF6053 domain-containing protein [Lysobacter enzymogenes]